MCRAVGNAILFVILVLCMLIFSCPGLVHSKPIVQVFQSDLAEAEIDLSGDIFADEWLGLPGEIQKVLVNMRYQLGPRRFRRLECMLASVRAENWPWMALEMQKSEWSKWSPERAAFLIKKVKSVEDGK